MTRVIVEALERSLPTTVPYRSERMVSFRVELDDGLEVGPEILARIREKQLADLDAQEALLRRRWKMPQPEPSDLARQGGDFITADKAPPRDYPIPPIAEPVAQADRPVPAALPTMATKPAASPAPPRGAPATKAQPVMAPALGHKKPDGTPFPPGATLRGNERRCSDGEHPANRPLFINNQDWDTSHRLYGVGLCQPHMQKRRTGGKA